MATSLVKGTCSLLRTVPGVLHPKVGYVDGVRKASQDRLLRVLWPGLRLAVSPWCAQERSLALSTGRPEGCVPPAWQAQQALCWLHSWSEHVQRCPGASEHPLSVVSMLFRLQLLRRSDTRDFQGDDAEKTMS